MLPMLRKLITPILLLLLPLVLLIVGLVVGIPNAWFFVLTISWLGIGLIFFVSIEL